MLTHMKRTTLVLSTDLYTELKKRAAQQRRTLTDVVEEALRRGLEAPRRHPHITLPSYDLGPWLVDPADRGSFGEATERPSQADE